MKKKIGGLAFGPNARRPAHGRERGKVVSFIYEQKVIKEILDHHELFEEVGSKCQRAPPSPAMVETIIAPYDAAWQDYKEPFGEVQTT